jgi:hypothetical protein
LEGDTNSGFSFGTDGSRDWERDYTRIENFLRQLWSGRRQPAKQYIETGFPCILTYAVNGMYQQAMQNEDEMEKFIEYLSRKIDDAANMDF